MSEAQALTNLVGNGFATVVVGSWTGDLDRARMRTQLERAGVPEEPDVELRADDLEQRQDIAHPPLVPER